MPPAGETLDVAGRRLRIGHLDRVLHPETGTTKAHLLDYDARVAGVMLPRLRDLFADVLTLRQPLPE